MSGLLITLSSAIVSVAFGFILPACGYNTPQDIQPATVDQGFRPIFSPSPDRLCRS